MGATYKAVQWNRNKAAYDIYVVVAVAAFIGVFMTAGLAPHPTGHRADPVVLLIRALGSAAFLMLTIILMIGPLARLSPRFLPMLYNRRHLGVMTFIVSCAHFGLALFWYHGGGPLNPFVSLLVSNPLYKSVAGFPFEAFGLAAFAALFLLAATSHDFWLNNLSAPVWKALHMLVYPAYGLLVLHVAYGALMAEKSLVYPALMAAALGLVSGLHLFAGYREWRRDGGMKTGAAKEEWVEVCAPADIPDGRAVIAPLPRGDRVALFRKGGRIHAIENACRHQNGPLGEGCLKDGLVTCPWHGWQYRLEDGVSPPPFTERVATYDVRLSGAGRVLVSIRKNPLGKAGAFIDVGAAP
jgi:nitrite reductase/ring-hydroxylating ferredoxin subunit/DMSO/TMAO reductase YedYZ heme-binding membrane subunit